MRMAKRIELFNEKVYKEVNEDSLALLDDYVLELKSKGRSEKTIYQYVSDIKGFLCWVKLNQKNKSVLELKKRAFRQFFLMLQDNGTSSARINRFQSSIRNMLEYAVGDDDEYEDYEINAMANIKGVQGEAVREIFFLTDEQIKMIYDYLIERERYQEALYLSLSYDSGARRNEIHQVLKDGFDTSKQTNTVTGKRGKKFSLIYFSRTRDVAKLYFDQRGDDDIESLWVVGKGKKKKARSYESLYVFATNFRSILLELTGEYIEFNSHTFRHTTAQNFNKGTHYALAELGKESLDLNTVKALLNHTSIETTQSYLKDEDEELLNETFGLGE